MKNCVELVLHPPLLVDYPPSWAGFTLVRMALCLCGYLLALCCFRWQVVSACWQSLSGFVSQSGMYYVGAMSVTSGCVDLTADSCTSMNDVGLIYFGSVFRVDFSLEREGGVKNFKNRKFRRTEWRRTESARAPSPRVWNTLGVLFKKYDPPQLWECGCGSPKYENRSYLQSESFSIFILKKTAFFKCQNYFMVKILFWYK